jgi:hypothetical protein
MLPTINAEEPMFSRCLILESMAAVLFLWRILAQFLAQHWTYGAFWLLLWCKAVLTAVWN